MQTPRGSSLPARLCQLASALAGQLANHLANDFTSSLLADLDGECTEQGPDDFCLDLALLEAVAIPVFEDP